MLIQRDSISRKLTLLNLLASAAALLCASAAFFVYDLNNARNTTLNNLDIQAQIVGYNCVTPLLFNDPQSAEKTLSALQASPHILYAGIYTPAGRFFAGYWRANAVQRHPLPLISPGETRNRWLFDMRFAVVQKIVFDRKMVGTVYIRSDVQELVARLESYLAILAGILIASLAAALLVSRTARRAISEPLAGLAETARIVSRDKNYAVRVASTKHHDEIAVLIDSFNEMLAEIQKRDATLQEREEQFRTLADSVPQLAWMAEEDGHIFWYNQRWYQYTGASPEEMVGWGWESVHDPNILPEVLVRWRSAIKTGKRFEMVFPLRGRDGNFRDFLTLIVPVRDASGKVVRWFGTNTDITEQRRSEEALRKSEKLAATGRLAASIAHEINNPLEAVANLLYLAKRQPADVAKYLSAAEQELDRIAEITRHTLGFYRETASPTEMSVVDVANEVLALYDRKLKFKKIAVKKRFSKNAAIQGFPGEIRQILANLVANAIEAVSPGGCFSMKIFPAREWGGQRRSGVRITIIDNGSGISPEQMKKIFEPFYTTKKDVGKGLGLWLTESLVRKHHGTIRVRSTSDSQKGGTAFSIFLPAEEVPQPSASGGRRDAEEKPNVAGA
jgi:PAS domain S-box-containing protein